ncbi:MAG: hypothetical protein GY711_05835 [bacterium]|nr:hypothetical protein [bacterium]
MFLPPDDMSPIAVVRTFGSRPAIVSLYIPNVASLAGSTIRLVDTLDARDRSLTTGT